MGGSGASARCSRREEKAEFDPRRPKGREENEEKQETAAMVSSKIQRKKEAGDDERSRRNTKANRQGHRHKHGGRGEAQAWAEDQRSLRRNAAAFRDR